MLELDDTVRIEAPDGSTITANLIYLGARKVQVEFSAPEEYHILADRKSDNQGNRPLPPGATAAKPNRHPSNRGRLS